MKKLMIALAAAATAVFAFGEDVLPHGADFEAAGYVAGENFTSYVNKAEDGVTPSGNRYWYSTSDDIGVISNHLQSGISVKSVPDLYENATPTGGVKYLQLDTQAPLFRTIKDNGQRADFTGVDMSTGDGVYLDTLVKFTAAEDVFGADALSNNVDKIAIEYVEREDDDTTDENEALTNFVIRAGYLSSPLSQTNYYAAVPANFDKDAWHRLTVRSLANIDGTGEGKGHVGFVVYLDGVPLEYDTNVDVGPGFTPSGAAAAFYTESLHALFPSAVQSGGNKSTIAAVAFSGNGSIDDVVFTTTMPEFIRTSSLVRTEITLGTGVTDVKAMVAGTSYEAVETNNTLFVFNLPALTTEFVLNVTADTANGYTFNPATCITASNDVTYVGATITITGGSPALTVVGKRDNAYYMDGETKVGFATLSDAFATAPAGTTLKLGYDYVVANNEGVPEAAPVFVITKDFVLDLNGKTLNGGGSDYYYMFDVASGVTFTVIDSVEGDAGSIVYGGTKGMFTGNGDTYIGSKTLTDYGPVFEGDLVGAEGFVMGIIRGKFSAADNTYNEAFAASIFLDMDSTATLVGSYWVVEPQGGSEPVVPNYELTIPTVANASAAVTSNGVVVADLTAIPSNTEVLVTWTADSGYKITAGATETITMDGNKMAATPTVEQDSGDTYPDYIEGIVDTEDKAEYESKYDTWKGAYGADTGSAYATAFLLNIAPSATDQTLEPASITISGSSVTITANRDLRGVNGKVYIKTAGTLAGLADAQWAEATVNTTTGAIEMTSNGTAAFFKIKVDF